MPCWERLLTSPNLLWSFRDRVGGQTPATRIKSPTRGYPEFRQRSDHGKALWHLWAISLPGLPP
jgi:hypothetical protein